MNQERSEYVNTFINAIPFIKQGMNVEHQMEMAVPETRFRIILATLPKKLQEKVVEFVKRLFHDEYPEYKFKPSRYTEFYTIGDIVISYIAQKTPDFIEPLKGQPLLQPSKTAEREKSIDPIKFRAEYVIMANQDFINKHEAIFHELEHVINVMALTRGAAKDLLNSSSDKE